ncbi:hnwd1 [Metarhizium brunneum]
MDMAISTSEDIVAILAEDSLHICRRHKQRGSTTPRIEYTTTLYGSFAMCRSARIVFSENSRFLAAIRSDTHIEVWDMNLSKRTSLFKFDVAVKNFTALVFNPDSTFLAASIIEESGKIQTRIWKVDSTNKTLPCGWDRGNTALACSVQFSNDGQWLAVRFSSLRTELWRSSGEPHDSSLDGENDQVTDLAFSWDSTKLGHGTSDGKVRVFDRSSNRTKHLYDTIDRAEKAQALSFSRHGAILAAMISDSIRIYNMKTGLYHDLQIPGSDLSKSPTFLDPNYCNISVFKNWTVLAEQQGCIYLWDAGKVVKVFSLDDISTPMRTWGDVVSTDLRTIGGGMRIVLGSNKGGIHIIDVPSGNVLHSVETGPLSTLATHQDENTFVSTSQGDIDLAQFYLDETETFRSPNPNDIIYRGYGTSGPGF